MKIKFIDNVNKKSRLNFQKKKKYQRMHIFSKSFGGKTRHI